MILERDQSLQAVTVKAQLNLDTARLRLSFYVQNFAESDVSDHIHVISAVRISHKL